MVDEVSTSKTSYFVNSNGLIRSIYYKDLDADFSCSYAKDSTLHNISRFICFKHGIPYICMNYKLPIKIERYLRLRRTSAFTGNVTREAMWTDQVLDKKAHLELMIRLTKLVRNIMRKNDLNDRVLHFYNNSCIKLVDTDTLINNLTRAHDELRQTFTN